MKMIQLICLVMLLPLTLLAQVKPSADDYAEIFPTDKGDYRVARLTPTALAQRLRRAPVSFGSNASCVLLNADGDEVFSVPFPQSDEFINEVTDIVLKNGGYPVSNGRVRAVFKQIEVENKDFDLAKTVDEEDWDY